MHVRGVTAQATTTAAVFCSASRIRRPTSLNVSSILHCASFRTLASTTEVSATSCATRYTGCTLWIGKRWGPGCVSRSTGECLISDIRTPLIGDASVCIWLFYELRAAFRLSALMQMLKRYYTKIMQMFVNVRVFSWCTKEPYATRLLQSCQRW